MSARALRGLLAIVLIQACGGVSQRPIGGTGPLPGPPTGNPPLSRYEPEPPFTELTRGVLARKIFEARGAADYRVEVNDLLIAPGQASVEVALPGPAVFEVRSGSGVVTVGGRAREVQTGASFQVAANEKFQVTVRGELPITLRVHIFRVD